MTVGLVVITYNRPVFFGKTLRSFTRHLVDVVDDLVVVNDGSDTKYNGEYGRAYGKLDAWGDKSATLILESNSGVAAAKNAGIEYMLGCGHDWIVVAEDDILAKSPGAVTEYIRVALERKIHHLSFAHHGPANIGGPVDVDGDIEFYPHSIGAWCLYSREYMLEVGLFDENFICAWEHVEHEMRAYTAGCAPGGGPHRFADISGSSTLLVEQPDSIEKSSIRPRPDWAANIYAGLRYWRNSKRETFDLLFGDGCPLQGYAEGILGSCVGTR